MEDSTIVELYFARSEEAIAETDKKYGKYCNYIAYNILRSSEDAEECVNDAYLGAWNAIPPAKPDPLLPFICKIVRNLSLKRYYHKTAARRNSSCNVPLEEIEACLAHPDTPESQLEARELTHAIEDFLDTLTRENRVIFMRRYWFCDSCRDIAGQVGLTEKTVTVRLTRIRRKLKDYLTEREVFL